MNDLCYSSSLGMLCREIWGGHGWNKLSFTIFQLLSVSSLVFIDHKCKTLDEIPCPPHALLRESQNVLRTTKIARNHESKAAASTKPYWVLFLLGSLQKWGKTCSNSLKKYKIWNPNKTTKGGGTRRHFQLQWQTWLPLMHHLIMLIMHHHLWKTKGKQSKQKTIPQRCNINYFYCKVQNFPASPTNT